MYSIVDIYYLLKKKKYDYMSDHEFSEYIGRCIKEGRPFMAGRMGAFESSTVRMVEFGYKNKQKKMLPYLTNNAGFFPSSLDLLPEFSRLYIEALSNCDVIFPMGYKGENYLISKYAKKYIRYYHDFWVNDADDIWNKHLKGKKVLVIHPFAETIKKQYVNNREKLHKSPDVLPEFDLQVLKAVFTAAGEKDERFSNWFEALDYMHEETKKIDYDIALIGCGAYGFPLASMIKKDGKIAVHMGGSLQLLFGIKGARWELGEDKGSDLYNEYWTYADSSERPKNFTTIEGSSYWETVSDDNAPVQ